MKCKRCGQEMKRQKVEGHKYRYVCPKCGLVIGDKKTQETIYQEAYETVIGQR